jgi:HPt (histidine-containing phosphotransfer) domain-containing protein
VGTSRRDVRALSDAIAARHVEDAHRLAHRVKGAALTVGARPMASLAQQVEAATAIDGRADWAAVEVLSDRLGDALAATAA